MSFQKYKLLKLISRTTVRYVRNWIWVLINAILIHNTYTQ